MWKQSIHVDELEKVHAEGSPASATVACDGQRVYSFFGSFGLLCYDLDGTPVWSKKLGPFRDEFGSASSPILVDGKVILCEDHDLDSFLIAINSDDGQTAWQTPRDGFTRSYATPVVWEADGQKQIVVAGALQLVAYDPRDGRQLWTLDGFARIVNTTPANVDGTLYVCTWSPGGDTDARIAMESWSTALDLWDKNKNARLEKGELPAGEVQSRFFRIDLDGNQIAGRGGVEEVRAALRVGAKHAGGAAPAGSGQAAEHHVGIQARLAVRPQPVGLSRTGVSGQGWRDRHAVGRDDRQAGEARRARAARATIMRRRSAATAKCMSPAAVAW